MNKKKRNKTVVIKLTVDACGDTWEGLHREREKTISMENVTKQPKYLNAQQRHSNITCWNYMLHACTHLQGAVTIVRHLLHPCVVCCYCFTCLFLRAAIYTSVWQNPCRDNTELYCKPHFSSNAQCIITNTVTWKGAFSQVSMQSWRKIYALWVNSL